MIGALLLLIGSTVLTPSQAHLERVAEARMEAMAAPWLTPGAREALLRGGCAQSGRSFPDRTFLCRFDTGCGEPVEIAMSYSEPFRTWLPPLGLMRQVPHAALLAADPDCALLRDLP